METCGAKTRAGTPCKQRAVYRNGRCKFHGGLATGPKTEAGRAQSRINGLRGGRPRKEVTAETGVIDTQGSAKVPARVPDSDAPVAPPAIAVSGQAKSGGGKPKSCTSLCARCSMLASNGRCLALAKGVIQSMATNNTCAGFDDFET